MTRLIRAHRGSLEDSMKTVKEVKGCDDAIAYILEDLPKEYFHDITADQITTTYHCHDCRILS